MGIRYMLTSVGLDLIIAQTAVGNKVSKFDN